MVTLTGGSGGWRSGWPEKGEVAAHLVNLAWNGLSYLDRPLHPHVILAVLDH